MKIDETVKQALEQEKCIARIDCQNVKMCPTCEAMPLTIMMHDGSNPCKNWNPTAEDLISDKWIVVD